MARQRKLFRFCQVIRPLMTRSGSRLPGVIRVLSSGDQGIPEPNEPLEGVRRQLDEKNKQDHASGVVHEIPSHAKFCVRSQLYHIASEKKSFFLISAPLTVENCRVWYSLWIF